VRIYSKTGDRGETGLIGGDRVPKTDPRIEAVGALDELNAAIGVARVHGGPELLAHALERTQNELFSAGAEIATPPGSRWFAPSVGEAEVGVLEREIDLMTDELPPLENFILPGGTPLAAALHVARTHCRRAERAVLSLHAQAPVRAELLGYLNRLSDWFFTAARYANHGAGVPDVAWRRDPA
jgi:ATP:cob(I)alamin adenosyltransferase